MDKHLVVGVNFQLFILRLKKMFRSNKLIILVLVVYWLLCLPPNHRYTPVPGLNTGQSELSLC